MADKKTTGYLFLFAIGAGLAYLLWPKDKFKVEVSTVDKENKQVSFTVIADGKSMSDTFRMGDETVMTNITGTPYYLFAEGKDLFGQITLAVGTLATNGGFIANAIKIVTF